MRIPRYREIADDLRRRLAEGEWPVGTALPGISALQEEYEVDGLNTIRQAQAILREEGLIAPEQGRGTFVVALPVVARDEAALRTEVLVLRDALDAAQAALSRVLRHLGPAAAG
jgi:DNA-binding GntR family transcriptional regulator